MQNDFVTIDSDLLAIASGGKKSAQPHTNPDPPHKDAASQYGDDLKQDVKDTKNRANGLLDSAKHGYAKGMLKNGGAVVVDGLKTVGDAIKPVKDLL